MGGKRAREERLGLFPAVSIDKKLFLGLMHSAMHRTPSQAQKHLNNCGPQVVFNKDSCNIGPKEWCARGENA